MQKNQNIYSLLGEASKLLTWGRKKLKVIFIARRGIQYSDNRRNILFYLFIINKTIITEMRFILNLNQHVQQTCQKTIYPLLRENDCKDTKMNTTRWEFVTEDPPQNKEEWKELIEWKIDETNPRQTIPVYGKLKVQENNIYLLVYMKYIKLREITQEIIDKAQGLEKNMKYIELKEITQEKIDKTKDLEKSLKYIKLREIE